MLLVDFFLPTDDMLLILCIQYQQYNGDGGDDEEKEKESIRKCIVRETLYS